MSALRGVRKAAQPGTTCRTQRRPLLPRALLRRPVRAPALRARDARRVAQKLRRAGAQKANPHPVPVGWRWLGWTPDPAGPPGVQTARLQPVPRQQKRRGAKSRGQRAAGAGGGAAHLLGRSGNYSFEGGRRPADGGDGAEAEFVPV
uniref:(northern house mosquito) hypothetical protein n=1 Tax=Culex pipiens TaxID=7175 RepID=A0A8D8DDD1_CULPI